MDGCDHCVRPALNWSGGVFEVKWGNECVWLLLRAAYMAGRALRLAWELRVAVLAALKTWISSPVEESGAGRLGLRVRKSRESLSDRRCDFGRGWMDLDSVTQRRRRGVRQV